MLPPFPLLKSLSLKLRALFMCQIRHLFGQWGKGEVTRWITADRQRRGPEKSDRIRDPDLDVNFSISHGQPLFGCLGFLAAASFLALAAAAT